MTVAARELWHKRLEAPAYRVGEAATYARISPQTVISWQRTTTDGRRALSEREARTGLSYLQLIEIAVVAAMRGAGVKLNEIRRGREYLARALNLRFPFAQSRFKTDGVDILTELGHKRGSMAERLLAANRSGQLAWAGMLSERFLEFDYSDSGFVRSWKVNGRNSNIIIDPTVSFGAPHIGGVPTWVLRQRWGAGEGLGDIADDYSLTVAQVEEGLQFEKVLVDPDRPNNWLN